MNNVPEIERGSNTLRKTRRRSARVGSPALREKETLHYHTVCLLLHTQRSLPSGSGFLPYAVPIPPRRRARGRTEVDPLARPERHRPVARDGLPVKRRKDVARPEQRRRWGGREDAAEEDALLRCGEAEGAAEGGGLEALPLDADRGEALRRNGGGRGGLRRGGGKARRSGVRRRGQGGAGWGGAGACGRAV